MINNIIIGAQPIFNIQYKCTTQSVYDRSVFRDVRSLASNGVLPNSRTNFKIQSFDFIYTVHPMGGPKKIK